MKRIIRNGKIVEDDWRRIDPENAPAFAPAAGETGLIIPLARYMAWREAGQLPAEPCRIGVLLGPDDAPESVQPFLSQLALVAVHFPAFTDGRGYSLGRLIRMRYAFAGELRAVGDILRDQLYFLKQCGFNAFELRPDQPLDEAVSAFDDYAWGQGSSSRAANR